MQLYQLDYVLHECEDQGWLYIYRRCPAVGPGRGRPRIRCLNYP